MKLHVVSKWEALDQIEAEAARAQTEEEYEEADGAFFRVGRAARAAWLELQDPGLYCAVTD